MCTYHSEPLYTTVGLFRLLLVLLLKTGCLTRLVDRENKPQTVTLSIELRLTKRDFLSVLKKCITDCICCSKNSTQNLKCGFKRDDCFYLVHEIYLFVKCIDFDMLKYNLM